MKLTVKLKITVLPEKHNLWMIMRTLDGVSASEASLDALESESFDSELLSSESLSPLSELDELLGTA